MPALTRDNQVREFVKNAAFVLFNVAKQAVDVCIDWTGLPLAAT